MATPTNQLLALEPYLEEVFEAFYQKLLSDRHFAVFFRDDAHVRSLIGRQRENLRQALHEEEAALRQRYVALGRMHHRIFVPYPDFAIGIDFLSQEFYRLLARHPEMYCSAEQIFRFFQLVKDFTAKGYLEQMVEEDKRNLDLFIHNMRESREAASSLIANNLLWLRQVLRAIEREDEELLPDLDIERSELFSWLLSDEVDQYIPRNEDQTYLFDILRRIYTDIKNLFYFLNRSHYTEVMVIYVNTSKYLLTLNNIVTVQINSFRLRELLRDPLTGLFNRKTLDETLRQRIRFARLSQKPMSILISDLDDFKPVNDTYGHLAGDCILQKTAEILQRHIRASDTAFRYGGEEFLVLLTETDAQGAARVAENIRNAIESTSFTCQGHALRITISIGSATLDPGAEIEPIRLVELADQRLYDAKRAGKNRVCS